jgi:hypothetical protein
MGDERVMDVAASVDQLPNQLIAASREHTIRPQGG